MTSNQAERVRILRKELNLSQEAFGEKVGVKKSAISKIEKGENKLSEVMAKAICREFKVNWAWLTEGLGDMFSGIPETIIDELVDEYELDDIDKDILIKYLSLPKNQRELFRSFISGEFLNKKGE